MHRRPGAAPGTQQLRSVGPEQGEMSLRCGAGSVGRGRAARGGTGHWVRGAETPGTGRATTQAAPGEPAPFPAPSLHPLGRGAARPSPLPLASVPLAELLLPLLLAAVPARLRSGPLGHFLSALKSVRRRARAGSGRLGLAASGCDSLGCKGRAAPRCGGGRGREVLFPFFLPCTGTQERGSVGGSEGGGGACSGRAAGPRGTGTGRGTARAPAPPCGRPRPGSPVRAGSRAGAGAARSRPAPRELRGGAARPCPLRPHGCLCFLAGCLL